MPANPRETGLFSCGTTLANSGSFPFANGSVTFNFYSSVDCTGTPVSQTGVSVSGSDAQSGTHAGLAACNYSFDAQYVASNGSPRRPASEATVTMSA